MQTGWFCEFGGQAAGPFSLESLRQMAAEGRVTPTTLVRRADWTGWAHAEQVKELRGAWSAGARHLVPLIAAISLVAVVVLGALGVLAAWKWAAAPRVARDQGGDKSADISAAGVSDKSAMRSAAAQGRRIAVIIGVNKYFDPGIETLRYCVADARLVEKTLVDKCGYDPKDILVIADDADRDHFWPLRINIEKQLAAWIARAAPEDTVLVFFSGHGFLDSRDRGYLAPKDCELENLAATSVPTEKIREALRAAPAKRKLLVLDCCHAGGAKSAESTGPSSEELGGAFLQGEGLLTLASCRKQETSKEWDKVGHGLFTYHLAEGLGGAADYDGDGLVDSGEIYKYVATEVTRTAQTELNTRQTPVELRGDDVFGVFALAKTNTRVAAQAVNPAAAVEVAPRNDSSGGGVIREGKAAGEEWSANGLKMKFRWCPAGTFIMGSPIGENDRGTDENQVSVTLTRGFWMKERELTQGEWQAVMETKPWSGEKFVSEGANYAASYIALEREDGDDVNTFLRKWNDQERKAGRRPSNWEYRLPTEAQWEYACRAGDKGAYCFGADASKLREYAWFGSHGRDVGCANEVGLKKPNRWGISDMHGNVWEWCEDGYERTLPGGTDPLALRKSLRLASGVKRGGSWSYAAEFCRSAERYPVSLDERNYDFGFRVALVPRPN